jgi:hypothetical protein
MGEAAGLLDTLGRLRGFMDNQLAEVQVGVWTLISTFDPKMHAFRMADESSEVSLVIYDPRSWAVAGGVLIDVPCGGYLSPLDFGDVGFCERSRRDIGVTVLGTVRYDWLSPRRPPVELPESWPEAMARLRREGLGATIRISEASPSGVIWAGDIVRLSDADVITKEFVTAPTTVEVSDLLLHSGELPSL